MLLLLDVLLLCSLLVKSTDTDRGPSPIEVLAEILTDTVWYGLNDDNIVYMFSVLVALKFDSLLS